MFTTFSLYVRGALCELKKLKIVYKKFRRFYTSIISRYCFMRAYVT